MTDPAANALTSLEQPWKTTEVFRQSRGLRPVDAPGPTCPFVADEPGIDCPELADVPWPWEDSAA